MTAGAQVTTAPRLVPTSADVVRAAIARCALAEDRAASPGIPERHGSIRLRTHQIDAAVRLECLLRESGGALLADEVGLGKTYVALALARDAREPMIVAPAALLPMWHAALERVRLRATLVSFERLSRAGEAARDGAPVDPDFVIVDEAHHVRTPTTRRYAALADLCARSRVLLLSATPLHNSRRDLATQLALFLGAAARTMSDAELTRFVVRRTRGDIRVEQSPLPAVAAPVWIELPSVDDCLELLLSLPPPVPPSDGGDGGALLVYSLVRRWASSRAAIRATLRRRLARAVALTASLNAGRYPSRAEIAAWSYAEGAVQLAFPELVAMRSDELTVIEAQVEVDALRTAVCAHEAAVRELLLVLDRTPDPDVDRGQAIRDVRSRHRGERVIAFAESAETVEAMFRHLRADAGVAMLRARGATVSGGALSRREALARFAPIAQGAREPHSSQRIDLLLTTDLLSEGVNLQDASVVVHLDLPWNPARLEQRVGRVSRLGSPHARVSVYAMRPPAASERLLAVERRLRAKLSAAGRALGVVGTILPGLDGRSAERGAAEEWTRVHTLLRCWLTLDGGPRGIDEPSHVAAVRSSTPGFVAALAEHGRPLLLASVAHADPSTSPRALAAGIDLACGADVAVDPRALTRATDMIDGWLSRRAAAELSGVDVGAVARARRRVLARITRVVTHTPRHVRSVVSSLAAEARRAALMPLGEGGERVLAELADAPQADQAWLRAIAAFGEVHGRAGSRARHGDARHAPGLVAVLLLVPPEATAP